MYSIYIFHEIYNKIAFFFFFCLALFKKYYNLKIKNHNNNSDWIFNNIINTLDNIFK